MPDSGRNIPYTKRLTHPEIRLKIGCPERIRTPKPSDPESVALPVELPDNSMYFISIYNKCQVFCSCINRKEFMRLITFSFPSKLIIANKSGLTLDPVIARRISSPISARLISNSFFACQIASSILLEEKSDKSLIKYNKVSSIFEDKLLRFPTISC